MPQAPWPPRVEEQREEHRREDKDDKRRVEEPAVVPTPSEVDGQRTAPDRGDPPEPAHVDLRLRGAPIAEVDRPVRSRARSDPDPDRVDQRMEPAMQARDGRRLLGEVQCRDRVEMEAEDPVRCVDERELCRRAGKDVGLDEGRGRRRGGRRRSARGERCRWVERRERESRDGHAGESPAAGDRSHRTGIGRLAPID